MRIAFDVKGTIEGYHKVKILKLFHALKARGHELTVWSNSYGYAQDAVSDNNLGCPFQSKTDKWQSEDQSNWFDFAIDDDSQQTWLAAKRFIWVHEVPDDIETFIIEIENLRVGHRGEGV
jgi:hypothetical protein